MAASIINFVDVTVSLAGAAADKFAFGTLLGVFLHTDTVNRVDGPFFSVAEIQAAGITDANVVAWATDVFSQDDGVDSVLVGREDAADANWTVTMDAIELAATASQQWYITNIHSRTDADILEVAAWTEAREKIYIAQSSDADILTDGAGNIAEDLEVLGYLRTSLIYHALDAEYLDGAWASSGGGMNLDTPGGVGIWAYRQLESITFDDVSGASATNIYSNNANLFGRNLGLSFTSKGTMASGRFIDITTSIDWVTKREEEEILALFVGVPTKIPYTNAGINQVRAAVQAVLDRGVTYGHFSGDDPPTVTAPDVSEVSSADKQARELTLTAQATLAGAVQKLILNITLTQ